ncbi:MAG: hypothetical protein Q9170_006222 [Blastenia crenularia]
MEPSIGFYTITAILLWCQSCHARPKASLLKRKFTITSDCKRTQGQKDAIDTKFGRSANIFQAAADATLDSSNKWAKYFFDEKTLGKATAMQSYYKKMAGFYGDSNYNVRIVCPATSGDLT